MTKTAQLAVARGLAELTAGFGSVAYWSRYFAGAKGPGGISRASSRAAAASASRSRTSEDFWTRRGNGFALALFTISAGLARCWSSPR